MLLLCVNLYFETFAQSTQDKEGVNKAVSSFMDSWNKHDFKNIHTYATADFSYINPPVILFKNRSEVENNLQSRHQTIFKNTPLKEESRDVRFIAPNVVIEDL
jgi:ketosteroid isomerase-like protein